MSSTQIMHIGQYRLLNVVYTGQTSRTWQAYDDRARRYVGIKTLLQSASRDRSQVNMMKWEYSVGSKLHHERFAEIYEMGKYNKIPYIAMEWVPAPNIKQYMQRRYENYCVFLPKMIDNFLFSEEGGVKLIDFALAKSIKGNPLAKLLGIKSVPQGTPSYMAPEQILGKQLDGRADIYSLGCTFFEILACRPTYTGVNQQELLQKHISAAIPSIRARNKNVTPEFASLLTQMMAKKVSDRPKSARDLFLALRSVRIFTKEPKQGDRVD